MNQQEKEYAETAGRAMFDRCAGITPSATARGVCQEVDRAQAMLRGKPLALTLRAAARALELAADEADGG